MMNLEQAAILIGVPVHLDDFLCRVRQSEWLAKLDSDESDDARRIEALKEKWEEDYKPEVAAPLCELIEFAQSASIAVKTEATLTDLATYAKEFTVLILFAHWKGPEIKGDDVLRPIDPVKFLERSRQDCSQLGQWLQTELERMVCPKKSIGFLANFLSGRRTSEHFRTVQELLHEAVFSLDGPTDQVTDFVLEASITRQSRRREALDVLFSGLLRPGNRLELYDGLHSKEAVEQALPKGNIGTLDLTTCTSTILADFLMGRRREGLRLIQYPTVQEFLWCAECVKIALMLFAEQGVTYQKARLDARSLLATMVREVANQREREQK